MGLYGGEEERDFDGGNFNPFESRRCPRCGKVAKPRMTGFYRAAWVPLLLVFVPAIWMLPWWTWRGFHSMSGSYYSPDKLTAIPLFLVLAWGLTFSRNAYRCRFCDAILW